MEKVPTQSSFPLPVVEIHGLVPRRRLSKKENLHVVRLPSIVYTVTSKRKIIEHNGRSIPLIDLHEPPVLLQYGLGIYHNRIDLLGRKSHLSYRNEKIWVFQECHSSSQTADSY